MMTFDFFGEIFLFSVRDMTIEQLFKIGCIFWCFSTKYFILQIISLTKVLLKNLTLLSIKGLNQKNSKLKVRYVHFGSSLTTDSCRSSGRQNVNVLKTVNHVKTVK